MMTPRLSNLGGLPARLFRKVGHQSAQARLVRDMRSLVEGRTLPSGGRPTIGFATFGSGAWHLAIEVLLAHALAQRGAGPQLLLCDMAELPICDERTACSRDRERCAGCFADKRELVDAAGVPWIGMRALVPADALTSARVKVAALDDQSLEDYCEGHWPIGRWLHVSASHFLRCDARGSSPEKVDTRRRLLTTAIVTVHAVERWLDRLQPDMVVAESGAHLMWKIALELARARGIPVVCREMGKGGWDRHIYALNADAMAPNLDDAWQRQAGQPLSIDEAAAVDERLENLAANTYSPRPDRPSSPDDDASISVPPGHRAIVAFTNVTWDLATAGRDVAFNGVLDWLCEAIRATARVERTHLIVRAHPAEASVITRERITGELAREFPALPAHVTVIAPEHPATAAQLIDRADLVLAYNSTAGLEAVMRGRQTIVSGRPHFRGKGFTTDVSTRGELAAAIAAPAAPSQHLLREQARRYFHLFYLRYHVPMGWTSSPLEPPYELLLRSLDELRPGRNPALDVVCDGILRGQQILLPRLPVEEVAACGS